MITNDEFCLWIHNNFIIKTFKAAQDNIEHKNVIIKFKCFFHLLKMSSG